MESPSSQPSPESGFGPTGGPQRRVSISLAAADCINYAAWQNSVPVVHSLEITNHRSEALHDLRLELTTSPAFARNKQWNIQKIEAGAVDTLKDRDVQIDPEYFSGLDEAERGVVRLQLFEGETVVAETERDIRVLAKDEWGGMQSMGELLAAFVTPNDPALAKLLKTVADVLAKHGHSPALDGYQSCDPSRAYMLAAATWSAVAAQSLSYANPPKSFEQVGQKTRRVTAILQHGLATCLDSTLLFAAALEALGLNPIVVMKQEHCFVGVWLVERTLSRLIEEDCSEIRKAIAARELVTFESTLVTNQPPGRFQDAVATATAAVQEAEECDFVAAIDIARARMAQIRPLASHERRTEREAASESSGGPLPLPTAPKFDMWSPSESDETPATPDNRINRWQRKLLDRLAEIRKDLGSDQVFDVVGEVFPANQLERMLREMYARQTDVHQIEDRIVRDVSPERFRAITESALEGLAKKELNLSAMIGKSAEAKERRLVPEVVEQFFVEAAPECGLRPKQTAKGSHVYRIGKVARNLLPIGDAQEARFGHLGREYKQIAFDKTHLRGDPTLDWVTPGHPLFEVVRSDTIGRTEGHLSKGAVFFDLHRSQPALNQRTFAAEGQQPSLADTPLGTTERIDARTNRMVDILRDRYSFEGVDPVANQPGSKRRD